MIVSVKAEVEIVRSDEGVAIGPGWRHVQGPNEFPNLFRLNNPHRRLKQLRGYAQSLDHDYFNGYMYNAYDSAADPMSVAATEVVTTTIVIDDSKDDGSEREMTDSSVETVDASFRRRRTSSTSSTTSSMQVTEDQEIKPFICPHKDSQCGYSTNRKNNLKRHIETMHQTLPTRRVCCGQVFVRKADIRRHVRSVHADGYYCHWQNCSKSFVRKALLERHLKTHTGEKCFKCDVCKYGTSHKSNLDRHLKTHEHTVRIGNGDFGGQVQPAPSAYHWYYVGEASNTANE